MSSQHAGARRSLPTSRRKFLRVVSALAFFSETARLEAADVFAHVGRVRQAPDFSLQDGSRKAWQMSSLVGSVVVVNFWATWCPPCRRELPSLEALHRQLHPKGVVVLAVNAEETHEKIQAFTAALDSAITFPLLMDEQGAVMREWGVQALPTTFVVDRRGRVVLHALGGRDFTQPDAIADVTALANEKP